VPVGVGADDHHIGDRLPPGQFVGVVLVRPDEHHRPLSGRDLVHQPVAPRGPIGDPQFENADELADCRRGAGPAEDHQVLFAAADRVVDNLPGVFPQSAGGQAGAGALGVGIGVTRQHMVADHVLDEIQRAARGRVVGISNAPWPIRAVEHLALADDAGPDTLQQWHSGRCGTSDGRGRWCCRAFCPLLGPGAAHASSMETEGGTARLLCTVQCEATARSPGHRPAGSPAGTRTVSRTLPTLAGRSVAMS
jgi:hypothetical protein